MFDLFHGLDLWVGLSLVLALTFVLAFEFINGFHDTANAVATVIYTKAMPPHLAVVLSGIFNFSACCWAAWAWPMPSSTCCRSSC